MKGSVMVVGSLRAAAVAALVLAASTAPVQAQVNRGADVLRYNNPLNQVGMYNSSPVLRYNSPTNQVGMYDNSPVLRYNNPTNQVGMYGNGFTGNVPPSQVNYGGTNSGVPLNNTRGSGGAVTNNGSLPFNTTGFGGAVTNNVGGPFNIPIAVSGGFGGFGGFGGNTLPFQNNGFGFGNDFGGGFNNFGNAGMIPGGFVGQPGFIDNGFADQAGFNNIAPGPRTAGQRQGQGLVGTGKSDPDASSVLNGTSTNLKPKGKAKGKTNVRRKTTARRR